MANEYGKDWRIHVGNGATPTEVFTAIGGEGSWDYKKSSDSIDLSSKDDGNYKAQGWGQTAITISVSGNLKLPDAGFKNAHDAAKAAPPEANIKLMKGAVVKFHGKMGVGNLSATGPKDGSVTYSIDFSAVAAPIVDDLTATA